MENLPSALVRPGRRQSVSVLPEIRGTERTAPLGPVHRLGEWERHLVRPVSYREAKNPRRISPAAAGHAACHGSCGGP